MKNRIIIAIKLLTGQAVNVLDIVSINGAPNMNDLDHFLSAFPHTPEAKLGLRTKKHQVVIFQVKLNNTDERTGRRGIA